MLNSIPQELTLGSFSLVGILTGYIWNNQSKRIKGIEKIQNNLPCNKVSNLISEMKTDIKWIKKNLK